MRAILLTSLVCGADAADYSIDMSDPWTIASIVILSLLFLLFLARVAMTFFAVSIETEAPPELEMQAPSSSIWQARCTYDATYSPGGTGTVAMVTFL